MNGAELALDVAMLLLGGTGVFEGLLRLASSPLEGVLIILGAMGLLMFPVASLCGSKIRSGRTNEAGQGSRLTSAKTE
jgi:hypothetical protein